MSLSCESARRLIVQGRAEEAAVAEHLRGCEPCRAFSSSEEEIAELCRRGAARHTAPAALRDRVEKLLAAEQPRERSAVPRRRVAGALIGGAGKWLSVAAVLVAVVTVVTIAYFRYQGRASAHLAVGQIARDYIAYASRPDRAEIVSSSHGEIEKWLKARVRLAVRVPSLPGARLVGARRCTFGERVAALVFYELQEERGDTGDLVSLYVFEGRGEDWSGMPTLAETARQHFCRTHIQGVSVLVWEHLGLTYALASQLEDEELLPVAAAL
ncbi:MAG: hypothetical protein V3U98_01740 [Acidobacteriota bacterium]